MVSFYYGVRVYTTVYYYLLRRIWSIPVEKVALLYKRVKQSRLI